MLSSNSGVVHMIGMQELAVILMIVVLAFKTERSPRVMFEIGHGIKSFKGALDEDSSS